MVGAVAAHPAHEGMAVLCEGLDPAAAHSVQRVLQARQVPYATTEGGQTILVPASLRAELIIELPPSVLGDDEVAADDDAEHPSSAT